MPFPVQKKLVEAVQPLPHERDSDHIGEQIDGVPVPHYNTAEFDLAAEEAEVRAALGRIAQMPHSAEKVEHQKELDEPRQLRANGVRLPYLIMLSTLGVS